MREYVPTTIRGEPTNKLARKPFIIPSLSDLRGTAHVPSHNLYEILLQPGEDDYHYHIGQQSNKMFDDNAHRVRHAREMKRRADVHRLQALGVDLSDIPQTLPRPQVDCLKVTLTMQINNNALPDMLQIPSSEFWVTTCADSLSSIMADTNTIITCPDKDESNADLRHQVSITGKLKDVEEARKRVQLLCVMQVSMPLVETKPELPVGNIAAWLSSCINEGRLSFPGLIFHVLPRSAEAVFKTYPTLRITGRVADEQRILEAVKVMKNSLYQPSFVDVVPVSTIVFVSSTHRTLLQGKDGEQMRLFSRLTGAHLTFPAQTDETLPKTLTYFIHGAPESVMLARKYVQAVLPIQLSFNVFDDDLAHNFEHERPYHYYDPQTLIALRVLRSEMESCTPVPQDPKIHYFCLTTQEFNLCSIYTILNRTLKTAYASEIPNLAPKVDFALLRPHLSDPADHLFIANRVDPRPLDLSMMRLQSGWERPSDPVIPTSYQTNDYTEKVVAYQTVDEPRNGFMDSPDNHRWSEGTFVKSYDRDGSRGYYPKDLYRQKRFNGESGTFSSSSYNYGNYNRSRQYGNNGYRYSRNGNYNNRSFSSRVNGLLQSYGQVQKHSLQLKNKNQVNDRDGSLYALNDSRDADRRTGYGHTHSYRSNAEEYNFSSAIGYVSPQAAGECTLVPEASLEPVEVPSVVVNGGDSQEMRQMGNGEKMAEQKAEVRQVDATPPTSPGNDVLKRMSALDLIKKAAEEPQAAARNKQKQIHENEEVEVPTPRTPTYAEILLEKKRSPFAKRDEGKPPTSLDFSPLCKGDASCANENVNPQPSSPGQPAGWNTKRNISQGTKGGRNDCPWSTTGSGNEDASIACSNVE